MILYDDMPIPDFSEAKNMSIDEFREKNNTALDHYIKGIKL